MNSTKLKLGLAMVAIGVLFSGQIFAADCPVGNLDGSDADPEAVLDATFGPGAAEVTRCIKVRKKVKVVYQINTKFKNSKQTAGYALGNINNAIKGYELTSGIKRGDYEIVAVVHSGGTDLVINGSKAAWTDDASGKSYGALDNPFVSVVQGLLDKGVKIYYCQNTARKKGVKLADMIPGVEFVTAGVTAIADFQLLGYGYVQP